MTTVPIPRAKPEGEGSYPSIIPMLPWYNYYTIVTVRSVNWFPGNKIKSITAMLTYPEEI